jgi:hypothetical protein
MIEDLDDLTLIYMYGFKNGKDSLKDEIERLLLIEQGAVEPCDTCGWRMKFPNAECRNCENAKLRDEIERLREKMKNIIEWCDKLLLHKPMPKPFADAIKEGRAALAGENKDGLV